MGLIANLLCGRDCIGSQVRSRVQHESFDRCHGFHYVNSLDIKFMHEVSCVNTSGLICFVLRTFGSTVLNLRSPGLPARRCCGSVHSVIDAFELARGAKKSVNSGTNIVYQQASGSALGTSLTILGYYRGSFVPSECIRTMTRRSASIVFPCLSSRSCLYSAMTSGSTRHRPHRQICTRCLRIACVHAYSPEFTTVDIDWV